MLYQQTP